MPTVMKSEAFEDGVQGSAHSLLRAADVIEADAEALAEEILQQGEARAAQLRLRAYLIKQ